jgi:competence protein ComEC
MNAPVLAFSVALIAGILLSYKDLPATYPLVGLAVGVAASAVWWRRRYPILAPIWAAIVASALGGLAGLGLGYRHYHSFAPDHVREIAAGGHERAIVEGVIAEEPADRGYQYLKWTMFRLEAESVTTDGVRRPASGTVMVFVTADPTPNLHYGQRVRLAGRLGPPEAPMNPGEADRRIAYAHERIYAVLSVARAEGIEVVAEHAGNRFRAGLIALRASLRSSLLAAAPGKAGAFLESILLGNREGLDASVLEDFVRTNTIHVLAINGYHMTLLAALLWALLVRLLRIPVRPAIGAIIAFVSLYCALTGGSPAILRATIMVVIYLAGRLLEREPRTLNSLALAAIAILAWNPGDLMNAGFQLSFAAILGLDLLYKPLKAAYVGLFPPMGARAGWRRRLAFRAAWTAGDIVLISVAAWLATAPLMLWHFHLVTAATVPANAAVMLPTWIVLNSGMLVLLLAPISTLAAKPFALVASAAADLLVWIVEKLASLPGIYWYLPDVRGEQVALSYIALAGLAWVAARGWRPRWAIAAAPIVAATVLTPMSSRPVPAGEARLAILGVGKGLTTVLRTSQSTVLFDCGAGRILEPGPRFVAPYLWREGVRSIDAVFLSHAHDDHTNAVLAIAERFRIGHVYVNEGFFEGAGGRRLAALLRERGVPVSSLSEGERPSVPGAEVSVLAPLTTSAALYAPWRPRCARKAVPADADDEHPRDDQNNRSLVLLVEAGGKKLLFPGDLEDVGTDLLLRSAGRRQLDADVLLIPHHGSANRRTAELARRVRARFAVASTKPRFARAATLMAYEEAGTCVVETWATGCIEVALGPNLLKANGFAGGIPTIPDERPPEPALPGGGELAPLPFPALEAPPPDLGIPGLIANRPPGRRKAALKPP